MKVWKVGILNDVHAPYHDPILINEYATGLVLDVFFEEEVDEIILNGDIIDAYWVSAYDPKHPDPVSLEEELNWLKDFLYNLRTRFPKAKITFLEGNHEARLGKFLLSKAAALYNLFSIPIYCDIKNLKINWLPYNSKYEIQSSGLFVQHSPPSYGENTCRTSLLKKNNASWIWGCTHRVQKSEITDAHGNIHRAWANGWLGSTTLSEAHRQVFSYAKGHENWQRAFCIATIIDETEYHVQQIDIENQRCVVGSHLYEG